MMASMGVVFCFHRWLAGTKGVMWSALGTFAATACLLLSRSNTSLFATMVGVMGLVGLMRVQIIKQRFSAHLVIGISGVILLYQLAIQDVVPGVSYLLAPITSLTGKDTTFSSRTFIWNVIKEHIAARPILGSGFGAYWTGPFESSPSYVFVYLMYFYPTESHNGYLEMMNDLGIPGLACILFFVIWYTRQGLQLMRYDRAQSALHFAVLFQQLVMNMSESEWFSRTSSFAILLLSCCCLSRSLYEYRSQGPPPGARA
jgi:O-antigen ligase